MLAYLVPEPLWDSFWLALHLYSTKKDEALVDGAICTSGVCFTSIVRPFERSPEPLWDSFCWFRCTSTLVEKMRRLLMSLSAPPGSAFTLSALLLLKE